MTLEQVVNKANDLIGKDLDKRHSALWLLLEFLEMDNASYHLHLRSNINDAKTSEYFKLLNKYLIDKIPVQYVIGHSYFYNRKFIVNKHTLIPRSETDFLVEKVLKLIDKHFNNNVINILDLGTGTGAIGITLKLERPNNNVTISDISSNALKVAKANAKEYNVLVEVVESSWFDNISGPFNVIVANPPYVANDFLVEEIVAKEPHEALYGGIDGLDPYRIILREAKGYLTPNSIIALEHGYDHREALNDLAINYFPNSTIIQEKDLGNRDRYTFIIIGE